MYFLDTATAVASVHAFWASLSSRLPDDVHIQVENFGDIIEDTTGDLTGSWSADAVAIVDGSATDAYAAPCGAVINWNTETIANHRRLRGKTFLVPLSSNQYQDDGSLTSTTLAGIQGSADDLVASQSSSFVVWHRGTGSDGSDGLITSATVHDFVAVLRSRRD